MAQFGKSFRPESVVPHREDMCHEFKGHSCISADEISPHRFYVKSKSITINAVSRTICGFLNTGFGGKALLGVFDDGKAIGLPLTADQQQHILLSLADTLERYNPPVPRERLRVRFTPVLSDEEAFEVSRDSNSSVHDSSSEFDVNKPHVLRRPHICCWCFKKAAALMRNFVKMERFVVEIVVLPWLALSSDLRNHIGVQTGFSGIALHPFYEDEEGKCYYRRQGTTQKLTDEDVIQLTRLQTKSAIRRYLIDNPKYYAWFRRK